jgi:hypothetical protein
VVDANGVEVQASHFLGELAPGRLLPAPRSGVRPATLGATDYGLERAVSDLCAGQQADFRNRFNADGIARDFDFTGASCWERDFREGGRGLDDSYADDTDLVFYMGHGWPDGFTFESSQDDGSVVFGDVVQAWGDRELEWLALLSCQVLADSSSSGAWWQRWGPAFDGLHQMLGFHTLAYDQGGFGGEFAEWMLGKRILFFRLPPMPIRSSWFLARQSNQPSSTVAAVIGALGPGGIACYDDYFWGRGPVGPDLRGANLRGWWRVTN